MQPDWNFRPYREGDMPGVVAAYNADFIASDADIRYGDVDIVGLLDRPDFDIQRQSIVVDGPPVDGLPEGTVLGFAVVNVRDNPEDNSRAYSLDLIAHPSTRVHGLDCALLSRLMNIVRSMERDPGRPPVDKVRVKAFCAERAHWATQLYLDFGFKEIRRYYQMACPLDNIADPSPVEGVTIRPYNVPDDLEPVRIAYNASFQDHFDHQPATPEHWQHNMSQPNYLLDISLVAEDNDEPGKVAALCLCGVYAEENIALNRNWGWIELLGTIREHRNKGLGRSILLSGLHSLRNAGYDTGALGVDTDSLTGATRLYDSVGFKVTSLWLSYEARLDEVTS